MEKIRVKYSVLYNPMELHSTSDLEPEIDKFINKYIFFADVINSNSSHDLVHPSDTDPEIIIFLNFAHH